MFGASGTVYVYTIYGMHHCMNIVTAKEGVGEAVLIRAVRPVQYIEGKVDGPAKLVKQMKITKEHNLTNVYEGPVSILVPYQKEVAFEATPRIGISQGTELLYRFVALP